MTGALRIALLGAESTGKTTTAVLLGAALKTQQLGPVEVLTEALRLFCLRHQRPPFREEQTALIEEQMRQEELALHHAKIVICDSCPYATALYSELLFEDAHLRDQARQHQKVYALTFVTWPDFAWQADETPRMRDGASAQHFFHQRLIDALDADGLNYIALTGSQVERTNRALAAILALIR